MANTPMHNIYYPTTASSVLPATTDMKTMADTTEAALSQVKTDASYVRRALVSGENMDLLTTPGIYNVTSFAIAQSLAPSLPVDALGGGDLLVSGSANYLTQDWRPSGASVTANPKYSREKNNSVWTAFHRTDDISPDKWNSALATRYDKGELAAGTDLNTLKSPGSYYIRNATNAASMTPPFPADSIGAGAFVVSGGANAGVQEWKPGAANLTANPVYQREWNNAVWTAFHQAGGMTTAEQQEVKAVKPEAINYAFSQTAQLAASVARQLGLTETPAWAYYGELGTKLTIPTHDGSGQSVHPSIVDVPGGWNGYQYWMGHTPYPQGNDAHEDPNVAASHDGTTWAVPTGLTNPLDDQPGSPGKYNSDICLTMGPSNTMYCFWRTLDPSDSAAGEKLYVRKSTNGTTWTAKELVYSAPIGDGLLSPSFMWTGSEWILYAVAGGPSPNTLVRMTSTSATPTPSSWSARTTCSTGSLPAGKEPWHVEVRQYSGKWYAILNDCTRNKAGLDGQLYVMKSDDGIAWENSGRAVIPQVGPDHDALYKATFLPQTASGRVWFQVWYSAWDTKTVTWNIFRTAVTTYL